MTIINGLEVPPEVHNFLQGVSAENAVMKSLLVTARENDALREACEARGIPIGRQQTMKDIAWEVARRHHMTLEELQSQTRVRDIAHVRQEAMWTIREVRRLSGERRYSLPAIGRFFGGRDHTTAIHACRRHQERLDAANPQLEMELALT